MGTRRRVLFHIGEEPWAASGRQAGDQLGVCPKKGGAPANGRNRSTTGVTSRWLFSKKVSGKTETGTVSLLRGRAFQGGPHNSLSLLLDRIKGLLDHLWPRRPADTERSGTSNPKSR